MKKNVSQYPNSALQELEILVGDWKMELANASFLPSSSETVTGMPQLSGWRRALFWFMYMGSRPLGTPDAIWLISRDASTPDYVVFYYDNRKVSRVYEMSFLDGTWKMWRNSPEFSQRFEGKVSDDGNIITAHCEKSSNGSTWEQTST